MAYRITYTDTETGEEQVEVLRSANDAAEALGCFTEELPCYQQNGAWFNTFLGAVFVDYIEMNQKEV